MAANMSVLFNAVDNISAKLGSIVSAGEQAITTFSNIESVANAGYDSIDNMSQSVAQSINITTSATENMAIAMDNSESEITNMQEAIESASEELSDYGDSAEEAGNDSEDFGERSTDAINGLEELLVSGGIIVAIQKVGEEFEKCAAKSEIVETAIAKLQTIAGESHIAELSEEILDLSGDSGQAAENLADVAYNAISAGTAVEESVGAAATATELATAGFTDSTSALSVLETAMNSYGDAAGSMEHVSDSLITVQNLGVTTVAELAAQMGKAISTASAYNVSLENLESGYISITKAGINTAEGTTYISSMLNELGNTGSEVSKVIKEETGMSFGQLMQQGYSLADALAILYESCDNNAEAMMNMWGSAEAGKAANAIISQGLETFNQNLNTLETSVGTTAEAYAIMADTTEFAHNKMDNAAQNMQLQIGNALNPTLEKLYGTMEKIYTSIGNIVAEHPEIVTLITTLTAGVAAFAGGIAVYTTAAKVATMVQTAFNGALAANPAFWVIGAVAALTAGLVLYAQTAGTAMDISNDLTYASQQQQAEVEALNTEYEQACANYGETSDEALRLRYELDEATDSFEENKQTMQEMAEECEKLHTAHEELVGGYEDNMSTLHQEEIGTMALIRRLEDLAEQSTQTQATQMEMEAIIGELNGTVDGLNLSYDALIDNTSGVIESLKSMAEQQAKQEQYQEQYDAYVNALKEETTLTEKLAEKEEGLAAKKQEVAEAEEAYRKAQESNVINQGRGNNTLNNLTATENALDKANAALEQYQSEYDKLNADLEENQKLQEGILKTWDETGTVAEENSDTIVTCEAAVKTAINSTKEDVEALAKEYSEAYEEALSSFEGQYALWDKVENKSKTSVDKINNAMQSQIDYWNDYADNLEKLQNRDIDGLSEMVAGMDDGSEESAAALSVMAKATDKELADMVKKYEKLQTAQSDTATKVAELETDFGSAMDDMSSSMKKSVDKMNMEEDAATAARKTIQGYINSIKAMQPNAELAAQNVANATAKALNKAQKFSLPGHADGTTDSETAYIAGEEGPELIISGGGDTVFPHSETESIIAAVSDNSGNEQMTDPSEMRTSSVEKVSAESGSSGGERTITLKLEGSGSINVGAGVSAENVWDSFKGSIKSTFMQILQEEMYEEGAEAYEF